MINSVNATIKGIALHRVGNKANDEGYFLSESLIDTDDEIIDLLKNYFLSHFNSEEYYHFYHETDINLNEAFAYISSIFDDEETLIEQSQNLAKHLYSKSEHPKIKSGEFYAVCFDGCEFNGEVINAVGLFKSENKDTFLKVLRSAEGFDLETEQGVNINKLDKGCLILNTERDNGYIIAIVDNTNKGSEAQYWVDDFLQVRQRQDEYFNTHNVLSVYKNFVTKELPQKFEVSKADQADLLNKSVQFFKENENFNLESFSAEVFEQPDVIESFHQYKDKYQQDNNIELPDEFDISNSAVKKQARAFKSIIKLDKNFHIYVHGDRRLIEQGEDEKGKFYKVYYKEES